MIGSQIKFVLRVFLKDKFFSVLNVLGLTLGISISIILLLLLQNDTTYDQHYRDHERIYRIAARYEMTGVDNKSALVAGELAPILKDALPEVEVVTRIKKLDRQLIKVGSGENERPFYCTKVFRVDSNYFQVFHHRFIAGDSRTCLSKLNSIVLTETSAATYFSSDALDKTLVVNNVPYLVTGVVADLEENTHLKFDILMSGLPPHRDWTFQAGSVTSEAFWNPDVYTYIFVTKDFQPELFAKKFEGIYNQHFKAVGEKLNGRVTPFLQPLRDIHFESDLADDEPHGNSGYLFGFVAIGIFIVVLASINYMNLSTAKAMSRANEIAMRKVCGSSKGALVFSILSESIVLALIALVLASATVYFIFNATPFNNLIERNLRLDFFYNPLLLGGSLLIALVIGLLSGIYPAFYLQSIPIATAVKGSFKNSKASSVLRKFLITTQFTISIFVIVCTILMKDQIHYLQSRSLGFDKDNVVVIQVPDTTVRNQVEVIKAQLLENPHIKAVTTANEAIGKTIDTGVMWGENGQGMAQHGGFSAMWVGLDYFETMDMKLLSGRGFHQDLKADLDGVYIANEEAVKVMGWGDEPLGKKVTFFNGENPGTVVGVVKNFNFYSLHREVGPMFILRGNWFRGYVHIKLDGQQTSETLDFIKQVWTSHDSQHPFEFFFLDQKFDEQYRNDKIQNTLLVWLSGVCIFISVLGLLGLSAFEATQRTREIGIRRVLGANTLGIVMLLAKNLILLILLAVVIELPLAQWMATSWMSNFAYRGSLNYLVWLEVSAVACLLVLAVVAIQSLKSVRANPVNSLKES